MTTQDLDVEETAEEREERLRRERAEHLAGLSDDELLAEATDAELLGEDRRLADLRSKPSGYLPIGHAAVLARLDRGLSLLAEHSRTLASKAAQECVLDPDGPSPSTLVALAGSIRAEGQLDALREAIVPDLEPDGPNALSIAEGDPRAEHTARRRAIEKRRDLIADELKVRGVVEDLSSNPAALKRINALSKKKAGK